MSRKNITDHIGKEIDGLGLKEQCRCPNCGHREPYQIAVPCYSRTCPKCGAPMTKA